MISRRTVVRTGVTAAWSVPVIQVVGAAPALAVSGPKISVVGGQAVWDGNYINVTVPLSNTGTQTIDSITITLTFSTPLAPEPNSAPGGWAASTSVIGGKTTITYTTSTAKLRAGGTISPTFVVKDKDHKGMAGSVAVAVVTSTTSAGTGYTIAAVTGGSGGGKG
jgi:hypothetical protein